MSKPTVLIICGVAGSGKTTVGKALAEKLGWQFADADQFHSAANIEKMSKGIPLTDEDRAPWLESMRDAISSWLENGSPTVLACSALKERYRQHLCVDKQKVHFIFLKAPREVLLQRLQNRGAHFMKVNMLDSQFETLEVPIDAITVDACAPLKKVISAILEATI